MLIIGSFYAGHFSEPPVVLPAAAPFLGHSAQGLDETAEAAVSGFFSVLAAVCEDVSPPIVAALLLPLLLLSVI